MNIVPPDEEGFARALDALACDEVVAYPTEAVYGLAVNPLSDKGLATLFSIKERDPHIPVLLIVADDTQLRPFVSSIDGKTRAFMKRFWPGPLSLLFKAGEGLPKALVGDGGHICLRCPGSSLARLLCAQWGGALTSTSANLSGQPPARTAESASLPGVALTLDGGVLEPGAPSTVFDAVTGRILRPGAVADTLLLDFWNE
ncbi:MAG: L-threonylcarbamoyladenylate synthase [Candidatus Hydrogenedens sp.]|jgi:L-threonylcarbamoyladenylate synthase|nr:L-threonylcarbamoyladenylate synthase [Candidatus Hydrogenedens sp.]